MSVINKIFDEVFVINMDRSKDRLTQINKKLNLLGITYTRISAVDGNKLSDKEINESSTVGCAKFCNYGTIGCALSHKFIWSEVIRRGLKKVLIFEDDAEFADDFDKRFLSSWAAVPQDWELVQLGCSLAGGDRKEYMWFDWFITAPLLINDFMNGHKNLNRGKYVDDERKIVIPDVGGGAHAYTVTNAGCMKLLQSIPKISYPGHIDLLIAYNATNLHRYGFSDSGLVTQSTFTQSSTLVTAGSPHLGNYMLDQILITSRGTRLGWIMSSSIARVGSSSIQLSCWRVVWLVLGFILGPKRLPLFAAAMIADEMLLGTKQKRNLSQLIFDISLFATGAFLKSKTFVK